MPDDASAAATLLTPPHIMRVAFPHQDLIDEVLKHFEAFLAERQIYKNTWRLGEDDEGDVDYGYDRRSIEGGKDQKEILHVRDNLPDMLAEAGVEVGRHQSLLTAGKQLLDTCRETARAEARHVTNRFPGIDWEQLYAEADAESLPLLRLLRYDPCPAGTTIAQHHADHGTWTLDVYGNRHDELEFGNDFKDFADFQTMPFQQGEALFFGGRKAPLLTDGRVPPLLHRVVARGTTSRFAIVYFDHTSSPKVDRWY